MLILKFFLFCIFFALPLHVSSDPLIYSGDSQSPLTNQLTRILKISKCNCVIATNKSGLIDAINATTDIPIFTIGITAASFREIKNNHLDRQLVAIYPEPEPRALIALGSVIFNKHSLALFYSDRTDFIKHQANGVRLVKTDKSQIRRELSRLTNIDALIAIPDSNIWNAQSFRISVNSLYRQGKALIGFNQSLAKAGAIAALYSDEQDIIEQLETSITQYTETGRIPESQYPNIYQVEINSQIARTLNIPLSDKSAILDAVNKELRNE